VDGESEVQCRAVLWHGLDFALRGEDEYFGSEEVQLDGVEEVHGVRLRVVQDFLDGAEPLFQFALVFLGRSVLVFPVGGKALFGNVVHAFASDLHFYPLALVAHQGDVKRLIAVGLRVVHPVAQAVGMWLVNLRDSHIDAETFVRLGFQIGRVEDDAYGQDVVDFLERDVLGLHLVPDGVGRLDTGQDAVSDAHLVQFFADGCRELAEEFFAFLLRFFQQVLDLGIFFGVLVLEAEVFQLGLDFVQPQPVGDGGIDVQGFARNLILLVGQHGAEGAHVVQTVGYLDEDDADVIVHREQQLLEVLGLCRSAVAEDAARNLGQSIDNLCHLRSEEVLDVLHRIVGVFHHIVQQGSADGGGTQADFGARNLCHGDGVHDIRFARAALHALVRLLGKVECLGDDFYLPAMLAGEVAIQKVLERLVYHFFVSLFLFQFFIGHHGMGLLFIFLSILQK